MRDWIYIYRCYRINTNSKLKKGWDKNPQKISYEQSSMLIGIDHSLFLYSFLIDCKAT